MNQIITTPTNVETIEKINIGSALSQATHNIVSAATSAETEVVNIGSEVTQFVKNEITQAENYILLRIGIAIAIIIASFLFMCVPQTYITIK